MGVSVSFSMWVLGMGLVISSGLYLLSQFVSPCSAFMEVSVLTSSLFFFLIIVYNIFFISFMKLLASFFPVSIFAEWLRSQLLHNKLLILKCFPSSVLFFPVCLFSQVGCRGS